MVGHMHDVFGDLREEYPHVFTFSLAQYERMADYIVWCIQQMGPADHTMSYDRTTHQLVMDPTGHNSGWYPMGASAVAFRRADDLMLFKLTWM